MSLTVVAGNPIVPFPPVGMIKSGSQQMTSNWQPVTNWIADTTFPDSVVTGSNSEQLQIQGANPVATIQVNLPFAGGKAGLQGISQQARVNVNGTRVYIWDPVSTVSGTFAVTTPANVNPGDRITVEVICSTSIGGVASSVVANGDTYVKVA
ncbi:hypothetical protein [Nocardia sp. NPDC051570]|uniref:hypothetical protein n=1 Tax=Nocardia sp. NPDC051570 TaxID=3364324 RepID=UPI0037A16BFE